MSEQTLVDYDGLPYAIGNPLPVSFLGQTAQNTRWFKTLELAAPGNVDVHVPTAGKGFVFVGAVLNIPEGLINTAGGTTIIQLFDGAGAVLITEICQVKGTTTAPAHYAIDLSSLGGYLSTTLNTHLVIDVIGAGFSTLSASFTAWGYEQ